MSYEMHSLRTAHVSRPLTRNLLNACWHAECGINTPVKMDEQIQEELDFFMRKLIRQSSADDDGPP